MSVGHVMNFFPEPVWSWEGPPFILNKREIQSTAFLAQSILGSAVSINVWPSSMPLEAPTQPERLLEVKQEDRILSIWFFFWKNLLENATMPSVRQSLATCRLNLFKETSIHVRLILSNSFIRDNSFELSGVSFWRRLFVCLMRLNTLWCCSKLHFHPDFCTT